MSNNNKTLIIGLLILLGVGGLIAFRQFGSTTATDEPQPQQPETTEIPQSTQSEVMAKDTDKNAVYAAAVTVEAPAGSTKYVLTPNSQASYTVKKVFVGKPASDVTGVTQDVKGGAWYDATGNKYYLRATIGLDKLKSDSEKRDSDILPLFTPSTAVIVINGDNAAGAISMTEPFETQVTADVTIGNTTKPVVFDVKGSLDAEKFSAEGTANVKMSDFGITPPTALNIFSVEDDTILKFNVEGEALEGQSTMEEPTMEEPTQ